MITQKLYNFTFTELNFEMHQWSLTNFYPHVSSKWRSSSLCEISFYSSIEHRRSHSFRLVQYLLHLLNFDSSNTAFTIWRVPLFKKLDIPWRLKVIRTAESVLNENSVRSVLVVVLDQFVFESFQENTIDWQSPILRTPTMSTRISSV